MAAIQLIFLFKLGFHKINNNNETSSKYINTKFQVNPADFFKSKKLTKESDIQYIMDIMTAHPAKL